MTVIRRDSKGNEEVVRGRKPRDVRDTVVVTRELLELIDTKCTFAVNVKGDHTTGFTLEFVNLDITEELECRTRGELNAMLRTLYYMHHRSIEPMYDRLVEAQKPDQAGTLESVIEDRDRYKRLYEDLRYDVEVAGKTIVQNTSTIKQLKEKAAAAERKLGNVAFTINRIAQTLTEISKPGEMPIQDIIEQSKCIHCERGVQLDGDTHIWEDGSHAFCPRKLKLTEVAGMTIGLNQQVYSSQWGCEYIVCYKCGKLLNLNACWLDLDGSQRHQSCLSKERLDQLQKA